MARLSWNQVAAPNLSGTSQIMQNAVSNWDKAFAGFSGVAGDVRNTQIRDRSRELVDDLARVKDEAGVDAFLQNLPGMINPKDMSNDLAAAIQGLRKTGLGYESNRAATANTKARTGAIGASTKRANSAAAREQAEYDYKVGQRGIKDENASDLARQIDAALSSASGTFKVPGLDVPLAPGVNPASVNPNLTQDRSVTDLSWITDKGLGADSAIALAKDFSVEQDRAETNRDTDTKRNYEIANQAFDFGTKTRSDAKAQSLEAESNAATRDLVEMITNDPTKYNNAQVTDALVDKNYSIEAINKAFENAAPRAEEFAAINAVPDTGLMDSANDLVQSQLAQDANEIDSSKPLRVLELAESNYGGVAAGQYGAVLSDKVKESGRTIGSSPGTINETIDRVVRETGVSPTVAAGIVQNTLKTRGFIGGVFKEGKNNDLVVDEARAIKEAKQYLNVNSVRDATEYKGRIEADQRQISQMQSQLQKTVDEIGRYSRKGDGTQEVPKSLKEQYSNQFKRLEEAVQKSAQRVPPEYSAAKNAFKAGLDQINQTPAGQQAIAVLNQQPKEVTDILLDPTVDPTVRQAALKNVQQQIMGMGIDESQKRAMILSLESLIEVNNVY